MTALSPEQEAFVAEARGVSILEALRRAGFTDAGLKRVGGEVVGPCPACGGTDRFSIAPTKNVFNCRGAEGGDAIALVRHLTGEDFLAACELLTGRDRPGPAKTAAEKRASEEARREASVRMAKLREASERKAAAHLAQENQYRDRERLAALELWRGGAAALDAFEPGPAEIYLAGRGLDVALTGPAFLRSHPACRFFHRWEGEGSSAAIHVGPAMLALFARPVPARSGWQFLGLHITWLDAAGPKGRPVLYGLTKSGVAAGELPWRAASIEGAQPHRWRTDAPAAEALAAGLYEILPTKKMRGSKKGGLIPLAGRLSTARRMVAGEGIETVLAFAGREGFAAGTFYTAAGDLGNLCGRAAQGCRVRHPFLRKTDAAGRERAVMVPGEEPDFAADAMPVPDWIEELVLLGDGDSEPVMTRLAMKRGARRHARTGRTITVEMAPPGMDFSDMAQAGRAA